MNHNSNYCQSPIFKTHPYLTTSTPLLYPYIILYSIKKHHKIFHFLSIYKKSSYSDGNNESKKFTLHSINQHDIWIKKVAISENPEKLARYGWCLVLNNKRVEILSRFQIHLLPDPRPCLLQAFRSDIQHRCDILGIEIHSNVRAQL